MLVREVNFTSKNNTGCVQVICITKNYTYQTKRLEYNKLLKILFQITFS